MKGENGFRRAQLKGYLFERFIVILLEKNGFKTINACLEPRDKIRENRKNFIEIKGRGCWHQIDCACDYEYLIPFSYPLRLLGETKFYATPLEKNHIRNFIGVVKDIQENYFVAHDEDFSNIYPRHTEIGVYFSASGFQAEAEKLAYAHGIKTISYENNFLIDGIKKIIIELEENYLSVNCLKNNELKEFINYLLTPSDETHYFDYRIENFQQYLKSGHHDSLSQLKNSIKMVKTSFIGMTITGVFIQFIGTEVLPYEMFENTDEALCRVYYEISNNKKYFWLEITGDQYHNKYYFSPPKSLEKAALFGGKEILLEKKNIFKTLTVNVRLKGINRNLLLHIDRDWLDSIY